MNNKRTKKTQTNIAARNRKNAEKSTGPKTQKGLAKSRSNALKHGMCANPAAGVVEDVKIYEDLYHELLNRIQPRNPVEGGLTQRLAVSLWRLNRAAGIDAAIANIGAKSAVTNTERVEEWADRIQEFFFYTERVQVRNPKIINRLIKEKRLQRGDKYYRVERVLLATADKIRKDEILKDPDAIKAMCHLMNTKLETLKYQENFYEPDAQLLAWLFGESAKRLLPSENTIDHDYFFYPDETQQATYIDELIGEARNRPEGKPIPQALELKRIEWERKYERLWDKACGPDRKSDENDHRTLGMLPDTTTLERILRYESHAERSLHRSLQMLAKLRGIPSEVLVGVIIDPTGTQIAGKSVPKLALGQE